MANVTVTYATFTSLYGVNTSASDFDAEEIEAIIDHAINMLNLQGRDRFTVKNMSGSAGSKSVSLKGYQSGAVMHVAWLIYKGRDPETASIGSLSYVPSSVLTNPTALQTFYNYVESLAAFEETPSGKVG
jgi:hypothetical protein